MRSINDTVVLAAGFSVKLTNNGSGLDIKSFKSIFYPRPSLFIPVELIAWICGTWLHCP